MPRTGRPRTFDRDNALEQAMHLFWEQGYERASLARLKSAMGNLSAPSFYAAFGSKDELFHESMEHYMRTHGRVTDPLHSDTLAPRRAIEKTLRDSARMQTDPAHPAGCLVTVSCLMGAGPNQALAESFEARRRLTQQGIERCVARAIDAGELPATAASRSLAVTLDLFLQGITLKARQGTSRRQLYASIRSVLSLWDALVETDN